MLRVLRPTRRPARGSFVRGALAAAVCLAALSLAGCGSDSPPAGPTTGAGAPSDPTTSAAGAAAPATSKPPTPHNQADIAFASSMIPHYVQVLASSQIASTKAVAPQVKAIAEKLNGNQVTQIESMSAWLANWGQPVPAGGAAVGGGSSGITQADLVKLSSAAPAGFDQLWLTTMIKHQQTALGLAQNELKNGQAAEAKALAKKIVTEQQAEITSMKGLLTKAKSAAKTPSKG